MSVGSVMPENGTPVALEVHECDVASRYGNAKGMTWPVLRPSRRGPGGPAGRP